MARQLNLKIDKLHVRYEDDYFCGSQPFSMGWVVDSVQTMQSQTGAELWNFSEFLAPVFDRISAKTFGRTMIDEELKDE